MSIHQTISIIYFFILAGAAALNYIPGVTDEDGVALGVFALDIFDDALHAASAVWALVAALVSAKAARIFLLIFGALYLGDGVLGLATVDIASLGNGMFASCQRDEDSGTNHNRPP